MAKLKEIIVVEGKDDTAAIKRALDADTIETNGSAISKSTIEKIRLAQEKRGVIIFTDPDFPGEKIRKTIAEKVPGCKHAFLAKHEARPLSDKGIGVEHARPESIRKALREAHQMEEDVPEIITKEALMEAGLVAGPMARRRRERLGELLKIGYTNGKQLHKRLMAFQIDKDTFQEALMKVLQEE
ncbi:ribonuclease M5 [Weizmannia acidilactici]|uniref:Ribonuclease M5 n=1 Tax=Weizmannia acidilactici TaxID=2607726 RepID=A0A5J4JHS9_9BACI|nr:ribonuclease M5 [Weizmannia acidilactici]GER67655.1 ribonuclease M5 [Weizmannia acidilactici]GER71673.1 ribonuclease M5 [Weizmannia acidilactici]GER75002.1 ribonuclease M5 [Weizmannia acidilactici]